MSADDWLSSAYTAQYVALWQCYMHAIWCLSVIISRDLLAALLLTQCIRS